MMLEKPAHRPQKHDFKWDEDKGANGLNFLLARVLDHFDLVEVDIWHSKPLEYINCGWVLHHRKEKEAYEGPPQLPEVVHHEREFQVDWKHHQLHNNRILLYPHENLSHGQKAYEQCEEAVKAEADGDRAKQDVQLVVIWVQKRRLLLLPLLVE